MGDEWNINRRYFNKSRNEIFCTSRCFLKIKSLTSEEMREEKIRGTNDEIMTISQAAEKRVFFGRVFDVNMQKKKTFI